MKTEKEINKVLEAIDSHKPTEYASMTYENGVEEALMWVVGDIINDEFSLYRE